MKISYSAKVRNFLIPSKQFNIYFFLYYKKLFCIFAPTMNQKQDITKLSKRTLKKYNKLLYVLCRAHLGKTRQHLQLWTCKDNGQDWWGEYCPERKIIRLYPHTCKTLYKYVKTFIHEYTHAKQWGLATNYVKMDILYGYRRNPFEVEARKNEKVLGPIIWKEFKQAMSSHTSQLL